jgi:hypothetical protein
VVHHVGEVVLAGGLLWALYRVFVQRTCPMGWLNDLTLIVLGLTIAIAPLHPFGGRPVERRSVAATGALEQGYFMPWLARRPALAVAFYLLAVAGGCAAGTLIMLGYAAQLWFAPLIPTAGYMWFGIYVRPAQRAHSGKERRDA